MSELPVMPPGRADVWARTHVPDPCQVIARMTCQMT